MRRLSGATPSRRCSSPRKHSFWHRNCFVSGSQFALRRAALQRRIAEQKLDAVLIAFGPNVRYLTGFTGSNGMLLLSRERGVFFTDPRYTIQAAREVDCRVQVAGGPLFPHAVAVLKRTKSRRVGFERNRISFDGYQYLKENLPLRASLDPLPGWVEQQRMVKSSQEISLIRDSVALNSRAYEKARSEERRVGKECRSRWSPYH